MKTKIIVVINQKGGVGKSTVAFHLAHGAVKDGKSRVLCIDLDSQGNLSQYITSDLNIVNETEGGVGLLFEGKPLQPSKTSHAQIDLLHGHSKLDRYDGNAEAEALAFSPDVPAMLRGLGYDYIVIDTPPAVGLRHLSALCWADVALIPMEPVMSGIGGLLNVVSSIDNFITALNPRLKWFGVVNRANMRVKSHRENDAWIRSKFPNKILQTLGTRTAVSDAMEESPAKPVWLRRGAPKPLRDDWRNFCDQVLAK
jgi:chromosome partitioning protein